jgi:hypothetical protein
MMDGHRDKKGFATRAGLPQASISTATVLIAAALVAGACSTGPPAGPLVSTPDDTPTRAATSPTGGRSPTAAGCPPTSLGQGPISSQVVVTTTAAPTAAGGSVLPVKTEITVLSDGPRVIARPQWSALEILGRGAVVARAVGTAGTDVPTPINRGTTIPAQTVPTEITLTGCDGKPLPPGAYRLRALIGYGSDALNNASGGSAGAFVMPSEPVDLTVT